MGQEIHGILGRRTEPKLRERQTDWREKTLPCLGRTEYLWQNCQSDLCHCWTLCLNISESTSYTSTIQTLSHGRQRMNIITVGFFVGLFQEEGAWHETQTLIVRCIPILGTWRMSGKGVDQNQGNTIIFFPYGRLNNALFKASLFPNTPR
jgi:hypothetical protein